MAHYRSNLRDVEFNLFEVNRLSERLGRGPFAAMDTETAHEVLREVDRLARGRFADSFVEGDRTPLQLDSDGNVTLPPGVRESLNAFFEGEWFRLQLPEHLGGYGAPPSLNWVCSSLLLGANPAAMLYTAGPFFAGIADRLVTDEQRERWIQPWVEQRWGGTMVLTEPDAGSDVGAARTRALPQPDGIWHLEGTKRFITNGDFDGPENIIHLILARPERGPDEPPAPPGTKGLSLFLVPKYWVEPDSSLGARNGAVVTGLEDKMGLKASSTCELVLGAGETPARGVLVGDVHDGIAQMFKVIEYARMLVGTKAIETLSTGYLNALAYTRERVQGPDLAEAADRTAARVPIIRHPDVRRMLADQKAHVEGLRALVCYTAALQDEIALAEHAGEPDAALIARNDLLLPLVKGYGSERSYELLATSLQVLGGAGYTRDFPIEQYIRDAKIDTLYEGTTGIQGMDLFFRKIGRDQGATLMALLAEVEATAKGDTGNGQLHAERELLGTALDDVREMLGALVGFLPVSIYLVGLNTTPFLFSLAELVIGWLLVRQGEVALAALDGEPSERDRAFYTGKLASVRWYARTVLPGLSTRREVLASTDLELMELDDAAW
ncbi:MAG: acyl-CoA dehydrogenase [Egibacteraceae bacterium]